MFLILIFIVEYNDFSMFTISALTLLVGRHEGHQACRNICFKTPWGGTGYSHKYYGGMKSWPVSKYVSNYVVC